MHKSNTSRRRIEENTSVQRKKSVASDEFGDAEIDDDALVEATRGDHDFEHIDNFADSVHVKHDAAIESQSFQRKVRTSDDVTSTDTTGVFAPVQLPSGRWSCNHRCKDKGACKHYCCKHGMDRPPKKVVPKIVLSSKRQEQLPSGHFILDDDRSQTSFKIEPLKRKKPVVIEEIDLTQREKKQKKDYSIDGPYDYRELHGLHNRVQKKRVPSSLHSVMHTRPLYQYGEDGEHQLSFLDHAIAARQDTLSKYGVSEQKELEVEASLAQDQQHHAGTSSSHFHSVKSPAVSGGSDAFDDDDSIFREAIVGLTDSEDLQRAVLQSHPESSDKKRAAVGLFEERPDLKFPATPDFAAVEDSSSSPAKRTPASPGYQSYQVRQQNLQGPFLEMSSSPEKSTHFASVVPELQCKQSLKISDSDAEAQPLALSTRADSDEGDVYSNLLDLLDLPLPANEDDAGAEQAPVALDNQSESSKQEIQEPKQVLSSFRDLEPWLFQKFGDIVDLVDE